MKICFFTPAFPGKHNTSDFTFVKQLVDAVAAKGNDCYVIAPYNILHYRVPSVKIEQYHVGDGNVTIYRYYYISLSRIFGLQWIKKLSYKHAIYKSISHLPMDIDAVYGHFWSSGYWGYKFAKSNNLPLFVATGESCIKELFQRPKDIEEFSNYVKGVICVSSKNRDESIKLGLTTIEKCKVFPNGVNAELFYQRDKRKCRELLGFPKDDFIVAFVGWFNDRKGSARVADALNHIYDVKSIFIGRSANVNFSVPNHCDYEPLCEGILFKGEVKHEDIPQYLSAADCFVLPTLREGCCNAIVEAMSCGLPIISSNLPFNWDVLDESNSILINPLDIEAITNAIIRIKDDTILRLSLSKGALLKAKHLTIEKRAEAIIEFIRDRIKHKD